MKKVTRTSVSTTVGRQNQNRRASSTSIHAKVVKSIPASKKLTQRDLIVDGKVNLTLLRSHLAQEGRLELKCALYILVQAAEIFRGEAALLEVNSPTYIFGDIHGQFYDLLTIFRICEDFPDNLIKGKTSDFKYLFLGDYVDRGAFGCEVILFLWSLKINYPQRIFFMRGNHEGREMTQVYSFANEAGEKYGEKFYETCLQSFFHLPLCAVVDRKFFCMHGCISPHLLSPYDVLELDDNGDRWEDIPGSGPMCDLVWGDPEDPSFYGLTNDKTSDAGTIATIVTDDDFTDNTTRGCSYVCSYRAITTFLVKNQLQAIIRAHQVQQGGVTFYKAFKGFPSVVCVFSAPNYCDSYENQGAILRMGHNNDIEVIKYTESDHPYQLSFSIFSLSLPFIAEKVCQILRAMVFNTSIVEIQSKVRKMLEDKSDKERLMKRQVMETLKAQGDLSSNDALLVRIRCLDKLCKVYNLYRGDLEDLMELGS
ncbi:hypothetical protein SNEBB_000683 [Seison nebaliae]|nr:hypothetical protein SNEBB_000683 [Seison nebaliae]